MIQTHASHHKPSPWPIPYAGVPTRGRLALSPKAVNNERTPPTLARDLGRGLDAKTCNGGPDARH